MSRGDIPATLGAVIRRRRMELGWNQEELAARASGGGDEVRQSDISRLECGRVGLPRRPRLLRIASALGLAPGDLLARSGWAGADGVMAEPSVVPSAPPVGKHDAWTARSAPAAPLAPAADRPGLGGSGNVTTQAVRHLRRAIDDAQQTRARTEQAMRRAEEIYALAANPRGRAPGGEGDGWGGDPER